MSSVKRGVSWSEENEANRLLARSRDGITKHSAKKDYLSPSQLLRRRRREVMPTQGFPEKNIVNGMAKRAYAPGREKGPRDLRQSAKSQEEKQSE